MSSYLRSHLGAKLFLSYLAVVVVGVIVLMLASQFVLPTSFNRHMAAMTLAPGASAGVGTGMMMGQAGTGTMSQLYLDFRASFNEALMYAILTSGAVAVGLSLLFSRSVITPVKVLSNASQRIAEGHYDERVQVQGEDELAQLAARFNQMAEKLNAIESMRRQLIGDVSHELRTPLTAIKGSMEGLMDGILPATDETYQQIHAEADRLNRLVDDLQELSRVEARAYPLDVRPVDVSALVQTVTKRLGPQAETRHILLEHHLPSDLPPVLADEDRVVQVLMNLTGNALQYTPEGGKVSLHAKPIDNGVQFSIQDTGIGIPQEHLPHIFDRFYRVDKSRSRQSGGGSGIGLTIARALVEAQGGEIWAESTGAGYGSTFLFTMPAAK